MCVCVHILCVSGVCVCALLPPIPSLPPSSLPPPPSFPPLSLGKSLLLKELLPRPRARHVDLLSTATSCLCVFGCERALGLHARSPTYPSPLSTTVFRGHRSSDARCAYRHHKLMAFFNGFWYCWNRNVACSDPYVRAVCVVTEAL